MVGYVSGRNAIYLDNLKFSNGTNSLVLTIGFNSNLCSIKSDKMIDAHSYELIFSDILALKIIELDSWDYEAKSSFDEIIDSKWIKKLGGKITTNHKHYFLQTYDDIFEVVCKSFSAEFES